MTRRILLVGDSRSAHLGLVRRSLLRLGHTVAVASWARPTPGMPDRRLSGSMRTARAFTAPSSIAKAAEQFEADLVNAHFASSYGYVCARAKLRVPLMINVWGTDVLGAGAAAAARRHRSGVALRGATVVCGTSAYLVEEIRDRFGVAAHYTPFGGQSGVRRRAQWAVPGRVFTARGLDKNYGVDVLLKALAASRERSGRWGELVIAGDGPERSALERLVRKLELSSAVTFLGRIPQPDVLTQIRLSEIVCVPTVGHEAFGVLAVEAGLMERPVVASNLGGLAEVIEEGRTGLLVPPGDAYALSAAVERILGTTGLAHRLGVAARERVDKLYGSRVVDSAFEAAITHAMSAFDIDS